MFDKKTLGIVGLIAVLPIVLFIVSRFMGQGGQSGKPFTLSGVGEAPTTSPESTMSGIRQGFSDLIPSATPTPTP
jgi:hypothetical protein